MNLHRFFLNIKTGIKGLLQHKLQSLLTMLGVVFGVGSVVAMLSVGEGASQRAQEEIRKLGSLNIILRSVKPQDETNPNREQRRSRTLSYGLKYDDLARLSTYPAIDRLAPAKIKREEARLQKRTASVRMVGTTPEWFELVSRNLIAGRPLMRSDLDSRAAVCVVAENLGRDLLAAQHMLGETVLLGSDPYTVVGIIETATGGSAVQMPDQAIDVYVPLNVMRERVGDTTTQRSSGSFSRENVELHEIIVRVGKTQAPGGLREEDLLGRLAAWRPNASDDPPGTVKALDNVEPTAKAIRSGLSRFHDRVDYDVSVPLALLRQARETQRIFSVVLGSIAGISLLVGGIGIMNIMLASVTERTKEIGLRRAVGAKRKQIIGQFIIETTVISVSGGLLGVALGAAIPVAIEHFAGMPTVVSAWSIALALGISVAVGVVFGLYPAWRAAHLDPIQALRHE